MLGEHIVTRSEVTRAIVSGYSPWCGVPAPPSASRTADLPLVYATKCRLSPPAPPAVHDLTTQSPAHPQPHHPTRRPPPASTQLPPQQMSTQHKGGLAEPLVSSAGMRESNASPVAPNRTFSGTVPNSQVGHQPCAACQSSGRSHPRSCAAADVLLVLRSDRRTTQGPSGSCSRRRDCHFDDATPPFFYHY